MLNTIKEFLVGFVEVVTSLVDFVIGFITDLVYVVNLCSSFVLKIPSYFTWLPDVSVTLIVTMFGIVVIYKILGREG